MKYYLLKELNAFYDFSSYVDKLSLCLPCGYGSILLRVPCLVGQQEHLTYLLAAEFESTVRLKGNHDFSEADL